MKDVFITHVNGLDYGVIKEVIEKTIPKRTYNRVVIKPNYCFSEYVPGTVTNPTLLGYVVRYFKQFANEVVVVESDNIRFKMDMAFQKMGIDKVVEREGGILINMSNHPDYKKYLFPNDLFVNLPLMKTHEFTLVTGAMKNLFGMIPDNKRVKYHPVIADKLIATCKEFDNQLIIMDAITAMEGHGPTRGKPVHLNVLISSTNAAAVDRIMCEMMGIDINEVPHVKKACQQLNLDGVKLRYDKDDFQKLIHKFKRPEIDPMSRMKLWVWRHKIPNRVLFVSPIYPYVNMVGTRIRRVIRRIMKMEDIDD